ncbi:uncharacterized protein V6R79_008400 [Siganus canaliculatus]
MTSSAPWSRIYHRPHSRSATLQLGLKSHGSLPPAAAARSLQAEPLSALLKYPRAQRRETARAAPRAPSLVRAEADGACC